MDELTPRARRYIIASALTALFLGAMDALVMSAAAPTIIADLGGLDLYAWVYSAYFLSRAVALPVFGKLSDLFNTRRLFLFSIALFLVSSIAAGAAPSMSALVAARVFQGIGAGGNFALVYIVLSEVALPGKRAKTLSFASSVWGISSIIGPTLGGVIVTWFSWRWIFYINIPLGLLSLAGIGFFLKEMRRKKDKAELDIAGVFCMTGSILLLLMVFMTAGPRYGWATWQTIVTALAALGFGIAFVRVEMRSPEPILDIRFFKNAGFSYGNGTTFFASFTIFTLFAYAPLFIQGALNRSPFEVGMAMLSLSLGWSLGSMIIGRFMDQTGGRAITLAGALCMLAGSLMALQFTVHTTMTTLFWVFMLVGIGMGFVTLSTMVLVQNTLSSEDLGVATSSHQFARTLGGTIGVGICGGLVSGGLVERLENAAHALPGELLETLKQSTEHLFRPEIQAMIPDAAREIVQLAVLDGVAVIFRVVVASALVCLGFAGVIFYRGRSGRTGRVDKTKMDRQGR